VIAPMATPALATLAILTYITAWGDYLWPLLVGSDDQHRVLTVALSVFRSSTPQGSPDWAGLMAATFVAALPMIILFLAFGRRVVNAIQFSGIK
jgi:multiple sugar transport system permease protein